MYLHLGNVTREVEIDGLFVREPFSHGRPGLQALYGIRLHVTPAFQYMLWQVLFSLHCIALMCTDVHIMH
jgi:hypothetical protein